MFSDDAYVSFLDKANQDAGDASTASSSKELQTKTVDTDVPAHLQEVDAYYISESDEKFEPVSLRWNGEGALSDHEFRKLIGHKAEVAMMSIKEFDPNGEYKAVVVAVEKTGKATVFKVESGGSRVEYYVVAVDEKEGRVVGLKAKAVES